MYTAYGIVTLYEWSCGVRSIEGRFHSAKYTLVRSLQSDRKRRWAIRKYVSDNGLGKLRNIAASSCHKLEFQPSYEYCACRKQFICVSCRRNPVNVLLYQKYRKHI